MNGYPEIDQPPPIVEDGIQDEAEKVAEIRKLFGHSFEIDRLDSDVLIPVGGRSIFSQETDTNLLADFSNLSDFMRQVNEHADSYDIALFQRIIEQNGLDIDPHTVADIFAFTRKFAKLHDPSPESHQRRKEIYRQTEVPNLSQLLESNTMECAEIAALACHYLQKRGREAEYLSGYILRSRGQQYASPHSFIVLIDGDEQYIYDPANPVLATDQLWYPSISKVPDNFLEMIREGKKRFVKAEDIIFKTEAFYGVNDGTNIYPERDIIG